MLLILKTQEVLNRFFSVQNVHLYEIFRPEKYVFPLICYILYSCTIYYEMFFSGCTTETHTRAIQMTIKHLFYIISLC